MIHFTRQMLKMLVIHNTTTTIDIYCCWHQPILGYSWLTGDFKSMAVWGLSLALLRLFEYTNNRKIHIASIFHKKNTNITKRKYREMWFYILLLLPILLLHFQCCWMCLESRTNPTQIIKRAFLSIAQHEKISWAMGNILLKGARPGSNSSSQIVSHSCYHWVIHHYHMIAQYECEFKIANTRLNIKAAKRASK